MTFQFHSRRTLAAIACQVCILAAAPGCAIDDLDAEVFEHTSRIESSPDVGWGSTNINGKSRGEIIDQLKEKIKKYGEYAVKRVFAQQWNKEDFGDWMSVVMMFSETSDWSSDDKWALYGLWDVLFEHLQNRGIVTVDDLWEWAMLDSSDTDSRGPIRGAPVDDSTDTRAGSGSGSGTGSGS